MSIGIIGTGWGVRVQVPAFRLAGLEISAIAGRQAEKTAKIGTELGIPVATTDWREVVSHPDVQVVSITTPPNLHLEMVLAALDAGKHVICEKPTAMNAAEAKQMWDAAQKHPDLLTIIDHELRFAPVLQLGKNMIAEGRIGAVRHILSHTVSGTRSDPNRAWNWWSDAAQGGGLWGAIGSHQIDTIRYLTGAEVTAVNGVLNTFIQQRPDGETVRPVTADDYYSVRLRLDDGVFVNMEGSAVGHLDEPSILTVYGTEGTLRLSNHRLYHAVKGGSLVDITPFSDIEIPEKFASPFQQATMYLAHAIKAYLSGNRVMMAEAATFEDGWRVQAVLDAARVSSARGGVGVEVG
ncbi:MAG: Gfo/Idh/MocA family oxidoreductase [Anaerolineae bacterium]|nr:MAG: Gfo/Idh/MocA family oxidoreductase [Anaerolineae bacterium]